MVDLVLEHPGQELVGLDGDLVAVEVEPGEMDLLGPDDGPGQPGHRQAALVVGPLPPGFGEHGVHHGDRARPVAGVVDEHALLYTDLGRGQADAGGLVHGLHHVVGELLERPVDLVDFRRPLAQHGVAVETDGVPRHARPSYRDASGSLGRGAQARTGSTSTRSRPGGRGTAASRSHNVGVVGGPHRPHPVDGPRTATAVGGGAPAARPVGVGAGPDTTAMALKGGRPRARRTSVSAAGQRPGSADTAATSAGGGAGGSGPPPAPGHGPRRRRPPAPAPRAGRPGPAAPAPARRPGTGGRAAPSRTPKNTTASAPARGAARLRCPPPPARRSTRSSLLGRPSPAPTPRPPARRRAPRAPRARGRHPEAQRLHPGGAAPGAHDGPLLAAASAAQERVARRIAASLDPPCPSLMARRRARPRLHTSRSGPAPHTPRRQQPHPSRPVDDAHHPPAPAVAATSRTSAPAARRRVPSGGRRRGGR